MVINKVRNVLGAGGDATSQDSVLTLNCDAEIVGGTGSGNNWARQFSGNGDGSYTAKVIPAYPSSSCAVTESGVDSFVEVENGCLNITVSAGNGDSCTITNTVFFESVPTLGQWGTAIMALLILGVGMVGFRRFA